RLWLAASRRTRARAFRARDGSAAPGAACPGGGERLRVPWLPTALAYDCGPSCLAMVLAFHGYESSVDDLRQRLGTSRDGTTGYELARVARELGLEARGLKVEDPAALSSLTLPAIAHYSQGHFVVIE